MAAKRKCRSEEGRLEICNPIRYKVSHAKKGGRDEKKKSEPILDIKKYITAKVW